MTAHPLNFAAAAALLLWGLWVLRSASLRLAGHRLERALEHTGPLRQLVAGMLAGALLPPATLTGRLLLPLATRERLDAAGALRAMLGAELGAALAATVLLAGGTAAFQLLALAGVALALGWPERAAGQLGRALLGAALALLSLFLASAAARGLGSADGPLAALAQDLPLAATLGGVLAMLLRSGLATVLLVATLAVGGALGPTAALALAAGASVGNALLAHGASGTAASPVRQAGLLLLACRLLLALAALAWLASGALPPLAQSLDPALLLAAAYLALAAAGALAFGGLAGGLARLGARWGRQPAVPAPGDDALEPSLAPGVALAALTREAVRLADQVERMLRGMLEVLLQQDSAAAGPLRALDDQVDAAYRRIKRALARLQRQPLAAEDRLRCGELMAFAIALEQLADAVERLLRDYQRRSRATRVALAPAALAELCGLHNLLLHHLRLAVGVLLQRDPALAAALADSEPAFAELARGYAARHLQRLAEADPDSVASSAAYLDMVGDLERMNSLLCGLGRGFLRPQGQAPALAASAP